MVVGGSVVYPADGVVELGAAAHCRCPASQESTALRITSLGKDENSKFDKWFLLNACCLFFFFLVS